MALRRVTPLNGADGYPRWKESTLLALNNAGVVHVLTDDPPPPTIGGAATAAAKQWAREDAVCRGYILGALSDRLWLAVARTYDVTASAVAWRRFVDLEIDEGAPLPEQVAHAEALGIAGHGTLADGVVAETLLQKLPQDVYEELFDPFDDHDVTMEGIWGVVRVEEEARQRMEAGVVVAMGDMPSTSEDQE